MSKAAPIGHESAWGGVEAADVWLSTQSRRETSPSQPLPTSVLPVGWEAATVCVRMWRDLLLRRGCPLCPVPLQQGTSQLVTESGMLGPCYPVFTKTVSYMNRCFPDPQALVDLAVAAGDSVEVANSSISDIVGQEIGSNLQVRAARLARRA